MGQVAHSAGQVIFTCHLPRDKFCQKYLLDPGGNNKIDDNDNKSDNGSDKQRHNSVIVRISNVLNYTVPLVAKAIPGETEEQLSEVWDK